MKRWRRSTPSQLRSAAKMLALCAVEVCAMIHHNPRHRRKKKISAASRANQVCRGTSAAFPLSAFRESVGITREGNLRPSVTVCILTECDPKPSPLPPGGLSLPAHSPNVFSPQIDMIGSGAVGGARVARPQPPPSLSITEAHGTQINCQFQSRLMSQICSVLSLPGGETSETNGSASI